MSFESGAFIRGFSIVCFPTGNGKAALPVTADVGLSPYFSKT